MSQTSGDDSIFALCQEVWQWRLKESPELATFCGWHQYDEHWDDISIEAYDRREVEVREFLERAKLLDTRECSEAGALNYTLLVNQLETYLDGAKFKSILMPLNYVEGPLATAARIVSLMPLQTEADFSMYLTRLSFFQAMVKQVIEVLRTGVREGVVSAYPSMKQPLDNQAGYGINPVKRDCTEHLDRALNSEPADLNLLEPIKNTCGKIPDEMVEKFKQRATDIVKSSVFPALKALRDFLIEEYLLNLRPHESIASLKNGEQWYQQCLEYQLSFHMTASEVQAIGYKEVARIESQILDLARLEGLPENLRDIRAAIVQRQANAFNSPEEVIEYVRTLCLQRIRPLLGHFFKDVPDLEMEIQPVPAYVSKAPVGYYNKGTPDGSRNGVYYVNVHNYKLCYPYSLPAISLHEGEPGHHLQCSYALANQGLPDFRRYSEDGKYYLAPCKFPCNAAYVEGWGLYCEALGEEMGAYLDNLELIGRYEMELFRAARLVVDPGLHAFGWTEAMAVEYMRNHTMSTDESIVPEIQRYISVPGQACAYKIGEFKMTELRRKAERALGPAFDLKEFHACILTCGAMPLHVLEEIVDKFIKDTKTGQSE